MNRQNAYNPWAALGLTPQYNTAPYGLNALGQQAHASNPVSMQQASGEQMRMLLNSLSNTPYAKLSRAQRMAKEVRERHPGMQVKRLTRVEDVCK